MLRVWADPALTASGGTNLDLTVRSQGGHDLGAMAELIAQFIVCEARLDPRARASGAPHPRDHAEGRPA
jgi:hypothetical protein